jgi:hypothetical protein
MRHTPISGSRGHGRPEGGLRDGAPGPGGEQAGRVRIAEDLWLRRVDQRRGASPATGPRGCHVVVTGLVGAGSTSSVDGLTAPESSDAGTGRRSDHGDGWGGGAEPRCAQGGP